MTEAVLTKDEVAYWKGWIAGLAKEGKLDWLKEQVNSRPLDSNIENDIKKLTGSIRILDVGAGPVSVAGIASMNPGLHITRDCTDPLGDIYTKLLEEQGISSPTYISKPAEELDEVLSPESYDYIFCRNALDHSFDCPRAIKSLLSLLKPGGVMRLRHYENEGIYANYSGFHRWNFMEAGGEGLLFSQVSSHNIRSLVSPMASICYQSMTNQKDDGSHRKMVEIVVVKPTGFSRPPIHESHGIRVEISDCGLAIKVTRTQSYNNHYPMFIHFISQDRAAVSTTLVWEDSSFRIYPLFSQSSASERAFKAVAIGQYDFTEGHNHYSPTFHNQWYQQYDLNQ
jgi:hypothetical protein